MASWSVLGIIRLTSVKVDLFVYMIELYMYISIRYRSILTVDG